MDNSVLEVKNLVKKFKNFTAVDNISFNIKEGEIVGILGPNGAGKTTTIHMLLGLITPTSGQIHIFGKDLFKNRIDIMGKVGFGSTYTGLKWSLTVYENLMICAYLFGVGEKKEQIKRVLENVEMWDLRDKKGSKLSAGQVTRIVIARALLNRPRLLLLDEPTASLDPNIAVKIQTLLLSIRNKYKVSIVYTSHNMPEVTKMCDRVIFLSQGKIMAEDTPQNLAKKIEDMTLILGFEGDKKIIKRYLENKGYFFEYISDWKVRIKIHEDMLAGIIRGLSEKGIWITEVDIAKPDLEDVFLLISQGKFIG